MIKLGGQAAEFHLHEKGTPPTVSCACENGVGRLKKRVRRKRVYEEQLTAMRLPQSGGGAAYASISGCSAKGALKSACRRPISV
jgi:hypothetical protein